MTEIIRVFRVIRVERINAGWYKLIMSIYLYILYTTVVWDGMVKKRACHADFHPDDTPSEVCMRIVLFHGFPFQRS